MATEVFAPEPEKRYGNRRKLFEGEKRDGHRVSCFGTRKTLWLSIQTDPEPEKRFGHRLSRS